MNKLQKIEKNQFITESEVESKLDILVEGQTNHGNHLKAIRDDLQKGFIGLALRNQELLELNKELNEQLEIVVSELKCHQTRTRRESCTPRKMGQAKTLTQT